MLITEDIAEKAVRHLARRAGFAEVKIIDLDPEIANAWRLGITEKDSNVFRFPYAYPNNRYGMPELKFIDINDSHWSSMLEKILDLCKQNLDIFVMTPNACQRTLVPSWTTEESILVQLDVLNASE